MVGAEIMRAVVRRQELGEVSQEGARGRGGFYMLPKSAIFRGGLHYGLRVGRLTITSRVNATNLFNHDPLYLEPQPSNRTLLQVVNRSPPRRWTLSTAIAF